MVHHRLQTAGIVVDLQLAVGAGAFVENSVHVLNLAADVQFVQNVIDEFPQYPVATSYDEARSKWAEASLRDLEP